MQSKILKLIVSVLNIFLLSTFMISVDASNVGNEISYESALTELSEVFDFETLYNELLSGTSIEELMEKMEKKNNTEYRVLIELENDSLLTKYLDHNYSLTYLEYTNTVEAASYAEKLAAEHTKMKSRIKSEVEEIEFLDTYFDVFNGFSATVKYKDIAVLESVADVNNVIISELYAKPETSELEEVEEEITNDSPDMMNVTKVWEEFGYEGQGMVIAILDTGLDLNHPAFQDSPLMPSLSYDIVNEIAGSTAAYQSYYSAQLAETSDVSTIKELTGDDLYKSTKVPFAFDYADGDSDVIPSEYAVDYLGNSHGTHVAGIVAGNNEVLTGVAPQAQLAIMKVFGDEYSGAYSDVLMSALSDCLYLGVDCINMSLGTPGGFAREQDSDYINEIYDQIRAMGINLYCSAGNSYSSTFMSPGGDYPLASNPDFGIASSSSSYYASTSVASIESIKNTSLPYFIANKGTSDEANVLFTDGAIYVDEVSTRRDFLQELISNGHLTLTEIKTFEYITIPGLGEASDYEGLDLNGKIALVKRGTISFAEKAQNALDSGAIAVIIYDNIPEYGLSVAVEEASIPMVCITLDAGSQMAERASGTLEIGVGLDYGGGTMSTFSSWGPLPSLELKPEITAPGGNVFSAIPFDEYATMSGTSMASPNMAAAGAIVKQYVEDMYSLASDFDIEIMVNRLLMSTATIVEDLYGNPYSPRKQGAGLANVYNAVTTSAYLYVYGQDKPKIELGDDKEEKGVYELSFRVVNFGNESLSYKIDTTVLTETLVSSMYLGQRADVIENYSVTMSAKDAELNGDILTVDPYKEAKVTVEIKLDEEIKQYLHDSFENGIYVEGFVTLEAVEGTEVDLSLPWLSFFGDWTKAPIMDNTITDEEDAVMTNTGVSGYVSFFGGAWESQFGTFIWDDTQEIDFNFEEYIAMCPSAEEGVLGIYSIYTGLLRGCKEIVYTARDMATGEVIYQDTAVNARKSYYENGYGYVIPFYYDIMFPSYEIPNNTWISFEATAYLDYDDPQNNKRNIFTFNIFVDNQAVEVVEQEEYDVYHKDGRTYVDVPVIDNHFLLDYTLWTFSGNEYYPRGTEYLTEDPIIVRDYNLGEINTLTIDLTDFKDKLQRDENGNYNLVISLEDYALNASAYNIKIPYEAINSIEINHTELALDINDTELLEVTFNPTTSWNQDLKWTSSNEDVVKVIDGRVLAVGAGSAVVTATAVDTADYETPLQVTCTITVSENIADGVRVEELTYTKDYYEVLAGETLQLELKINPWYSNDIIYWESSNEEVATVENGLVTAISTLGENYQEITIKAYVSEEVYVETEVTIVNEFTYLVDETGGIFDGKKFVIYYNGKGGDIVIPEGVYGVLDYTFVGNTNVTSVTFPSTLEFLGEHAFYLAKIKKADFSKCDTVSFMRGAFACCYDLEEVILPKTVYSDLSLFHTCTSLVSVTMPENWHQRLYEYDEANNLVGYDAYKDYLNTLTDSTFANCESLASIEIPDTVNTIEFYAFYNCLSLKSIELKENITKLGLYAFDKAGLEELDLTNTSLTEIPMFAFAECESLTKVILKEGITTIDAGAFYYCKNLKEINFPSTLKDYVDEEENYINGIGVQAFYDTALTTVDLSNTKVEVIGSSAFIYCTDLETVIFPDTLKEIGGYAFYNHAAALDDEGNIDLSTSSKLKNVDLGNNLVKISEYAFSNNANLENINLPNTLEEIASYAFSNSGLKEVKVPRNVNTIGTYAFSSINNLRKVEFENNSSLEVLPEGFAYNSINLTNFIWPDHLLEVGSYAFEQTKIVSMVVPETVTKVDKYAFSFMAALKDITFNSTNLEVLGQFAFSRTNTLESVTFIGNVEVIDDYAFIYTNIKTITLPNGLTNIGVDGTFFDCQSLETIIFQKDTLLVEDGVYRFSAFLFLDSMNIKEFIVDEENIYYQDIDGFLYDKTTDGSAKTLLMTPRTYVGSYVMPEGVESVAPYAFYKVTGLTSIELNDVTTIHYRGFHGCENITTVDLTNVKSIGLGAFSECLKLKDIILPTEVEELGESAFSLTAVEEITIPGTYKEIPGQLFYHCQNLRKVIIEEGIISIGDKAFEIISTYDATEDGLRNNVIYEESNLEEVIIPSTVTYIGARAFAGAQKLTSVELPDALQYIGDGVFDGCESLESIDLKNVVYIGVEAFRGCTNLYEVTASKYVTYIYEAAFKDCTSLLEFRLPERLIYLGQYAFEGCSYLEKIIVPKGMGPIMIISSTFGGCIRLEEIIVEEGNRSYDSKNGVLFTKNFVELVVYPIGKKDNSYSLPEETLSIYHEAFINNEYIQEVVFNKNLKAVGDKAFYNCTNLTRVVSYAVVAPALRYYYETGPMNGFSLDVVYGENNFKCQVLEIKYNGVVSNMELVIPSNAVGYDTNSWKLYFPTVSYSQEVMGKEAIELFNLIEELTVTSTHQKTTIEELLEQYNNLPETQKGYITNIDKLSSSLEYIAELEEIAASNQRVNEVIYLINNLNVTTSTEEEILTVKSSYDSLTTEEQEKITNYINLELCLANLENNHKLNELEIINTFINLVNDVINSEFNEKTAKIATAKAYYESIDPELVANTYTILLNEETKYNNELVALEVVEKITSITLITTESESLIKEAEEAYNLLTEEQKKYVSNYHELVNARTTYEGLVNSVAQKQKSDTILITSIVIGILLAASLVIVIIKKKK